MGEFVAGQAGRGRFRALAAGEIGEDHLREIGHAIEVLPSCVSASDRDDVERSLVREAVNTDPPEDEDD